MTTPASKISFGNVSFRREQIAKKSDYVANDGRQRYSVTFKSGQKIDYPEQKGNGAFVTTDVNEGKVGLFAENIKNATIYDNPNKSDIIHLSGNSGGNSVVVDNDCGILNLPGACIGGIIDAIKCIGKKQEDSVILGSGTKDNIVKMDKKDSTFIVGAPYPNGIVQGEGVCEQDTHINGMM